MTVKFSILGVLQEREGGLIMISKNETVGQVIPHIKGISTLKAEHDDEVSMAIFELISN